MKNYKIVFTLLLASTLSWAQSSYTSKDYMSFCLTGKSLAGKTQAGYNKGIFSTHHIDGTDRFGLGISCRGLVAEHYFKALQHDGYRVYDRLWTGNNVVKAIWIKDGFGTTGCYNSVTNSQFYCFIGLQTHPGVIGAFERVSRADAGSLSPVDRLIFNTKQNFVACLASQEAYLKISDGMFSGHRVVLGCRGQASTSLTAQTFKTVEDLSDRGVLRTQRGYPVIRKMSSDKFGFGPQYGSGRSFCEKTSNQYLCEFEANI